MQSNGRVHILNPAPGGRYAVEITDLHKRFKRHTLKRAAYTTLKSSFLSVFRSARQKESVFTDVLKDLTLRIPRGSSVGVIGKNGSGKSTLLKLISGIYKPDKGSIKINGRIAALIELGAGFHPDFSGRENLYLGGIMHGLTRDELDSRFEEIVKFAELEDVIDDPVRTYSSGMYMRLGFSLAIHTDPDILMVDEVLAVGDATFIHKCKDKIADLRRAGKTLVLVTHDLDAVARWCDEVLWLHEGEVKERGDPRRVIDAYLQFVERKEEAELIAAEKKVHQQEAESAPSAAAEEESADGLGFQRWGGREIEITAVRMVDSAGTDRLMYHPEDALAVEVDYLCNEHLEDVVFGIGINRSDGVVIHGSNTEIESIKAPALGVSGTVRYRISRLSLLDGTYTLDVAAHRSDGYPFDYHRNAKKFAVRSAEKQVGVFLFSHSWEFSVNPTLVQEQGKLGRA